VANEQPTALGGPSVHKPRLACTSVSLKVVAVYEMAG
jgi:hypothetical protein